MKKYVRLLALCLAGSLLLLSSLSLHPDTATAEPAKGDLVLGHPADSRFS